MNRETREYINNLADAIRKAFNVDIPINNIEYLVNELGGTIREFNGLDALYDGTIRKTGDNSFIIAISPNQSKKRKNFTIAHELGHLFLHMGYIIDQQVWEQQSTNDEYRRFGRNEQEYQANEFAAALLMPREMYTKAFDNNSKDGLINVGNIADCFNVSIPAAINRGKFLGLIQ